MTLNRLPRKETVTVKKSLLPTENVLDSTKESSGEESDTDTETSATSVEKLKKKQPKIRTVNGQSCCLTVSPLQMAYAEHECGKWRKGERSTIFLSKPHFLTINSSQSHWSFGRPANWKRRSRCEYGRIAGIRYVNSRMSVFLTTQMLNQLVARPTN